MLEALCGNMNDNLEKPTAVFPDKLIKLNYSQHSKERLIERTTGSLILAPQYIRLNWDNTIERKIKNGRVVAATAVINYKHNINMYLPIDIRSGTVKTIFFRNVKKKKPIKKELLPKKDWRIESAFKAFEKDVFSKNTGTEGSGERGFRENVEFIQPIVERVTFAEKMLGLWNKYIWRK